MSSSILETRQHKTKIIKTVLDGPKSRQINETRESLGSDPNENLACDTVPLLGTAAKDGVLASQWGWDGKLTAEKTERDPCLTTYTKINARWITKFSVKT